MQEQCLDVSARESAIGFCFFVHIAFNTHLFSILACSSEVQIHPFTSGHSITKPEQKKTFFFNFILFLNFT